MSDEALACLEELHALVWGESPRLLNEDSGGDSRLDLRIRALLAAPKGEAELIESCAQIAENACLVPPDGGEPTPNDLFELVAMLQFDAAALEDAVRAFERMAGLHRNIAQDCAFALYEDKKDAHQRRASECEDGAVLAKAAVDEARKMLPGADS